MTPLITISTHKVIRKEDCPDRLLDDLKIINPVYLEYERMGLSTRGIPQSLYLYKQRGDYIYIPRNIALDVEPAYWGTPLEYKDETVDGQEVQYNSKIDLWPKQESAVDALANTVDGILVAPCGSGKTVMALDAISRVNRTTLILVHKEFLQEQWAENIRIYLREEPGVIRGSHHNWKDRKIVIAMLQTLYSQRGYLSQDFLNWPGLVITDETHRISAPTWSEVIQLFPAKRRWGLTATPNRPDRLEIIFKAHIGNPVYKIPEQGLKPIVYRVATKVYVPHNQYINRYNNKMNRANLISYLVSHTERNRKILAYLINAARAGRQILVLTERVAHAKFLKRSLEHNIKDNGVTTSLFIGETTKEERASAVLQDVIFATSQMAKEALDIPTLDTLFLVTPSSSPITIQQSTGRILRECEGKKTPMVLDFIDSNNITMNMGRKRLKIYEHLGYDIRAVSE